jgi:hypothetical protein
MVIRAMPKNPKSLNPAQQQRYVVQARNRKYQNAEGKWVGRGVEEELTHIPIEKYEFKGWD